MLGESTECLFPYLDAAPRHRRWPARGTDVPILRDLIRSSWPSLPIAPLQTRQMLSEHCNGTRVNTVRLEPDRATSHPADRSTRDDARLQGLARGLCDSRDSRFS